MSAIPAIEHFIDLDSLSSEQLWGLLRLAKKLKDERRENGRNESILEGKYLAMIFQKPSLRTRTSFELGMHHLGGYAFYLSPQEVQLGVREAAADVIRVLDGYVDGVMARVFSHQHIMDMTEWGQIPVINGLSDFSHPCQALTDVFTIWEHLSANGESVDEKVLVYVGDGANNVANSLILAAGLIGLHVRVVAPKGYLPAPELLDKARGEVVLTDDLDGVIGADILYTDVWTSMGQEEERSKRMAIFPPYQVNPALIARTGNPDVAVMHCLPAHRGEEITNAAADGEKSLLFPQAHNRLHAQKAVLAHLLGHVPLE